MHSMNPKASSLSAFLVYSTYSALQPLATWEALVWHREWLWPPVVLEEWIGGVDWGHDEEEG